MRLGLSGLRLQEEVSCKVGRPRGDLKDDPLEVHCADKGERVKLDWESLAAHVLKCSHI